jgi:hypothetical protein
LENDLYGWTRDPAAEDYSAGYSKWWSVQTSVKKFDPFQPPDIFVKYRQNTGNYALSRDLGNNSDLKEWTINGNINFEKNYSNEDDNLTEKGNGGSFIEVLDKHGKVITRWFPHIDYKSQIISIHFNNQIVVKKPKRSLDDLLNKFQPFSIHASKDNILFQYGPYSKTTGIFDPSSDWRAPKALRFYFWANGRNYDRVVDLDALRFRSFNQPL